MKEVTKLKKLNMTSVDLVRRGANQEADFKLFKSADYQEDDIPQSLLKSIQDAVKNWWSGEEANRSKEFEVTKSAYMDAIEFSMNSIFADDTLDSVAKAEMADKSIDEFCEAMKAAFCEAVGAAQSLEKTAGDETLDGIEKTGTQTENNGQSMAETTKEGDAEMKKKVRIDKSRFDAEDLKQYEALIAKAAVDDEEEFEDEEEFVPENTEKSAEMHPEVAKALAEVEAMKKSFEMAAMHEVAKKYSVVGKKEDELAETLYNMKKSSPAAYDEYVKLLDEQVGMVEKSSMFVEIGKSGHGMTVAGGDTVGKIHSIASEIQKADPKLSRSEAIMKAWDQNPELLADYERKYQGGK